MNCIFCFVPSEDSICDSCFTKKQNEADLLRQEYEIGQPYPHIVLDGFFAEQQLRRIIPHFPNPDRTSDLMDYEFQPGKHAWDLHRETSGAPLQDQDLVDFLSALTSERMLKIVERITGMRNLESDPTYYGAGIQQVVPGGRLEVHTDFRRMHTGSNKYRRLNILIYFNPDWKEEYGGIFELWDDPPKNCVKSVLPLFNRTVIFGTTGTSWHGHTKPVACPRGMTRKSIALYYYSEERGEQEQEDRPVQWWVAQSADSSSSAIEKIAAVIKPFVPLSVRKKIRSVRTERKRQRLAKQ